MLSTTALAAAPGLLADEPKPLTSPKLKTRYPTASQEGKAALVKYEKAVRAMKQLARDDRRNWIRQAEIHNDSCPHGNWFFLPWHRAYLRYFEQACRDVLGDPDFALPYWDWSNQRSLPAEFWVKGSALYHASRDITADDAIREDVVGPDRMKGVQNLGDFLVYGSPRSNGLEHENTGPRPGGLENPHNAVHGFVGGDMGDYMSPLDPIFWVHHANIDRLWAEWQRVGSHATPSDTAWGNQPLVFPNPSVKDGSAESVETTPFEVLTTEGLQYNYDTTPLLFTARVAEPVRYVALPPRELRATAAAPADATLIAGTGQVSAQVKAISEAMQEKLAIIAAPGQTDLSARLLIRDMDVDPKTTFGVRVFLNDPDGKATKADDPHFVGDVFFFGLGHPKHHGGPGNKTATTSAVLGLNATLKALGKKGDWKNSDSLNVRCVPISVSDRLKAAGAVKFRDFRIEVATAGKE